MSQSFIKRGGTEVNVVMMVLIQSQLQKKLTDYRLQVTAFMWLHREFS